jgi:hypothetical protein
MSVNVSLGSVQKALERIIRFDVIDRSQLRKVGKTQLDVIERLADILHAALSLKELRLLLAVSDGVSGSEQPVGAIEFANMYSSYDPDFFSDDIVACHFPLQSILSLTSASRDVILKTIKFFLFRSQFEKGLWLDGEQPNFKYSLPPLLILFNYFVDLANHTFRGEKPEHPEARALVKALDSFQLWDSCGDSHRVWYIPRKVPGNIIVLEESEGLCRFALEATTLNNANEKAAYGLMALFRALFVGVSFREHPVLKDIEGVERWPDPEVMLTVFRLRTCFKVDGEQEVSLLTCVNNAFDFGGTSEEQRKSFLYPFHVFLESFSKAIDLPVEELLLEAKLGSKTSEVKEEPLYVAYMGFLRGYGFEVAEIEEAVLEEAGHLPEVSAVTEVPVSRPSVEADDSSSLKVDGSSDSGGSDSKEAVVLSKPAPSWGDMGKSALFAGSPVVLTRCTHKAFGKSQFAENHSTLYQAAHAGIDLGFNYLADNLSMGMFAMVCLKPLIAKHPKVFSVFLTLSITASLFNAPSGWGFMETLLTLTARWGMGKMFDTIGWYEPAVECEQGSLLPTTHKIK